MDKPCCVGVSRNALGLRGSDTHLGDLPVYFSEPCSPNSSTGVIVVHDIFGYSIPNCKYIVDHLGTLGFHAAMANHYSSDRAWPANEFEITEPLSGEAWNTWWASKTSPEFWAGFLKEVAAVSTELKSRGCSKVAIIGFCWGGQATLQAAATGDFVAAVSLHGAAHGLKEYSAAKCPVLFVTVDGDDYFPEETRRQCEEAGAQVKVYPDMYHGFVVRGDFEHDEKVRKAADDAMKTAVEFINRY